MIKNKHVKVSELYFQPHEEVKYKKKMMIDRIYTAT